jgi:O-antigen/teichoic acid export membrane protein
MAIVVNKVPQLPDSPANTAHRNALLGHIPEHQRSRILLGMRWTVWLSAIAIPFSVSVNLLLARVGPETIGVYGLLSVYVSLTSAFLYFGGDGVVIRYTPDCRPDQRGSFLVSYLAVILALMTVCLVFAWCFPRALSLAFGESHGDPSNFYLLCLAVVPIAFAMVVASLKGMLEIRFSQVLMKLLAIGSLGAYAVIFAFDRALLSIHPKAVIWGVYLGLSALLAVIGGTKIVRLCRVQELRWFLPDGFWKYALSTQQVSLTSFFANRLDYILIVNFGGLRLLGKYVAVMAVGSIVKMVSGFFMDTLFPALTNTIATRNHIGARQLLTMHARILFLVVTATSCTIMVLAVPATAVLGPNYASLAGPIVLAALCCGVNGPGGIGGTVLASIARQQFAVWVNVLNLGLFIGLFVILWPRWNLAGAVVADGVALTISYLALMAIAQRTADFFPSIYRLWLKASAVQAMVGFVAWWCMPLGSASIILVWLGAMTLFLWLAQYDWAECRDLLRMFSPGIARRSERALML